MGVVLPTRVGDRDIRWRTDKYAELSELILDRGLESVLDVGCRNGVLGQTLARRAVGRPLPTYIGMDLGVHDDFAISAVCDLSAGLPLHDGAVDMAIGLDVVEHLDDFQGGLEELTRVSRRYVAVTLPNIAHAIYRAQFLRRGRVGAKYDLAYGYGKDRHRWLTVLHQTDAYLRAFAEDRGLGLTSIHLPLSQRRSGPVERVMSMLGFDPSWYVWVTLYILEKRP